MAEPQRVTASEAVELLGIDRHRIGMWKVRGIVRPIDYIPGRGRGGVVPIYDLADLRRARDERPTPPSRATSE